MAAKQGRWKVSHLVCSRSLSTGGCVVTTGVSSLGVGGAKFGVQRRTSLQQ